MRESGVVERLSKTVQNELMNITTIFLGVSVGATTTATAFLNYQTLAILVIGILAFALGSAGGVLLAKFMNLFTKNKINPLIGSAGVSAVPMAARVSQTVGQEANPGNFFADARHGSECGRSYRFCRCSRYPALFPRIKQEFILP